MSNTATLKAPHSFKAHAPESLVEYGSRRVIITITAIVCALLEIVDTTIVNLLMI
jgi:DHA2 family multidrug resistance protein